MPSPIELIEQSVVPVVNGRVDLEAMCNSETSDHAESASSHVVGAKVMVGAGDGAGTGRAVGLSVQSGMPRSGRT